MIVLFMDDPKFDQKCKARRLEPEEVRRSMNPNVVTLRESWKTSDPVLFRRRRTVTDYNFTLDALALKPSGFCNVRVNVKGHSLKMDEGDKQLASVGNCWCLNLKF